MTLALPLSGLTIEMINLYQRRLSPLKGFSCAYRVARRRESCSQFAKRAISRCGVILGALLLRRRFRKCHVASNILEYERRGKKSSRKAELKRSWDRSGCNPCDVALCCDVGGCDGSGDIGDCSPW